MTDVIHDVLVAYSVIDYLPFVLLRQNDNGEVFCNDFQVHI